jgi:hypothetical protein
MAIRIPIIFFMAIRMKIIIERGLPQQSEIQNQLFYIDRPSCSRCSIFWCATLQV